MSLFGHHSPRVGPIPYAGAKNRIGVIGGSGLCRPPAFADAERYEVDTPYGKPSGEVRLLERPGMLIAFIPRHGVDHTIPPHKVPYKANLSALQSLGIQHVVATCAVGSLREEIPPGTFVVPDQFIDFTWGRDDTSAVDRTLIHLPMAEPYCSHLRAIATRELAALGYACRDQGCVVVIQGPRFSTIAESNLFSQWGGDIVNMTQYPECYFARELGMCYSAITTVTDYDVGIPSAISMVPGNRDHVLKIFRMNTERTIQLLNRLFDLIPELTKCKCAQVSIDPYYAKP